MGHGRRRLLCGDVERGRMALRLWRRFGARSLQAKSCTSWEARAGLLAVAVATGEEGALTPGPQERTGMRGEE